MQAMTGESEERQPTTLPLLCQVIEVAEALCVSRSKVYLLMNDGSLPSVRIGARRLVRRVDLERFVSELSAA